MRSIAFALLLAACGGGDHVDSGTYRVTWTVTDSTAPAGTVTCDSYQIADVIFAASDTTTGESTMISHPCSDGAAELDDVPLGMHHIKLDAMGTAGDLAGRAEIAATLDHDGQVIVLTPAAIEVMQPSAAVHTIWQITKAGAPSDCTGVAATGVAVTLTDKGGVPVTDVWTCGEPSATTPIAYGAFQHSAQLLAGARNTVIADVPEQSLAGARGVITVPVTFAVP